MNKQIGTKIHDLRKQKGWSQEQVADSLQISQSAYARIERGESNSWATHLESISNLFEIAPEELVKQNSQINKIKKNNCAVIGYNHGTINQVPEGILENMLKRIAALENK
jgi:transcriptional regulator with XRE-family HTH domain